MAKKSKANGKPIQLPAVTIKGKRKSADSTSMTRNGEVSTRRIDSLKKANPGAAKWIGTGYKGTGGKTTYGPDASDVIKAGLSPRKKK